MNFARKISGGEKMQCICMGLVSGFWTNSFGEGEKRGKGKSARSC